MEPAVSAALAAARAALDHLAAMLVPPPPVQPPAPASGFNLAVQADGSLKVTGTDKVTWSLVKNSEAEAWPWYGEKHADVTVPATGLVIPVQPVAGDGDFVKVVYTKADGSIGSADGPKTWKAPARPPVTQPPAAGAEVNLLVRGQSNAMLFVDRGGVWKLAAQLKTAGFAVSVLAEYGTDTSTIHSGTPFMTWDTAGQQKSLLAFLAKQPAEVRARKTITLWIHNEYEQNSDVKKADWLREVRADAALVRAALGQTAATTPYIFIPVRYNYGKNWEWETGMKELVADASFNATFSDAFDGAKMSGDGQPNSSHLGDEDMAPIAAALAPAVITVLQKLAGGAAVRPPVATVPPVASDDYAFAQAFQRRLGMGACVEREYGMDMTPAACSALKAQGVNWLRLFPPSRPGNFADAATVRRYLASMKAANSVGMPAIIDACDYLFIDQLKDPATEAYVRMFAAEFAAAALDQNLSALGAVNEYAVSNADALPFREKFSGILAAANPKSVISDATGEWGDPEKGLMQTVAVAGTRRRMYGWHSYHMQAEVEAAATALGARLRAWAKANNVVAYCGEWGKGPADGSQEPKNSILIPQVVRAASRGFGAEGAAIWTITGPDKAWWRANKPGVYDLRDDVSAALIEAKAYLKPRLGL